MPGNPRVLVAGGGIGGLAAALALLRMGCDVEVCEQAAQLREVGAGLQLAATGTRALYALGIGDELKALSCEAESKEIRIWNSGETWKLHDLGKASIERYGYPYLTVYRPDLLGVLERAVRREKPNAIRLGAKCTGFEQTRESVSVRLEDGQEVKADVLVGADGVHSRVRQGLFGPDQAEFTGIVVWRGIVPMDALPRHMARMVGTNWVGPGGHVVHYPLRGGKVMNFVGAQERSDWRGGGGGGRGTPAKLAPRLAGGDGGGHAAVRGGPVPPQRGAGGGAAVGGWDIRPGGPV